jgi:hypothetical protein
MLSLWKTLTFNEDEYDPKCHERSNKAHLGKLFLAHTFINRFYQKILM